MSVTSVSAPVFKVVGGVKRRYSGRSLFNNYHPQRHSHFAVSFLSSFFISSLIPLFQRIIFAITLPYVPIGLCGRSSPRPFVQLPILSTVMRPVMKTSLKWCTSLNLPDYFPEEKEFHYLNEEQFRIKVQEIQRRLQE